MPRCTYIGQSDDLWLPNGERCDQETTTLADRDADSRIFKGKVNGRHTINAFYPSKQSDMCFYHWNKLRCRKHGVGRQS